MNFPGTVIKYTCTLKIVYLLNSLHYKTQFYFLPTICLYYFFNRNDNSIEFYHLPQYTRLLSSDE